MVEKLYHPSFGIPLGVPLRGPLRVPLGVPLAYHLGLCGPFAVPSSIINIIQSIDASCKAATQPDEFPVGQRGKEADKSCTKSTLVLTPEQ